MTRNLLLICMLLLFSHHAMAGLSADRLDSPDRERSNLDRRRTTVLPVRTLPYFPDRNKFKFPSPLPGPFVPPPAAEFSK